MKVAVVGTGAIGGYFGARLAASGEEVTFLARGAMLEAMRSQGLHIESVHGDLVLPPDVVKATDEPADVGRVDIVLFTVKSYDTDEAAKALGPMLGAATGVISLQNGIDNEEKLASAVGRGHVIGGVAYILARVSEPGSIAHTGGPTRIVFGELDGSCSARVAAFDTACRRAGFGSEVSATIAVELWAKFAFICAQAGTTAATRMPIGTIRDIPDSWALFRAVLEEAWQVGRAEGVPLPDDLVERHLAFAGAVEPHARSSLSDDLVAGRRLELDALLGELVRRGEAAGVPVPVSRALVGVLRPWQLHNEEAAVAGSSAS